MLAEHVFDIGLVVDNENVSAHVVPPSRLLPDSGQGDYKFSKNAQLRFDVDRATVLFHHDVVAHRKTEPGSFACGFSRKEGIEYLLLYLRRNSHAIVTDADFHFISAIFRRAAADVSAASSVREGLERFSAASPDVVVCDLAMPEEDGFAFLRAVRALPASSNATPVIALTAFGRPEDRSQALTAGFESHGCLAGVTKDSDGDGLPDTFVATPKSSRVCYRVRPNSDAVKKRRKGSVQFLRTWVEGVDSTRIDRRAVTFIVFPPMGAPC